MWDDGPSSLSKPPGDLLASKPPFSDLAMSKTLNVDTSPFCSIFTEEMLCESNLQAATSGDDDSGGLIEEKGSLSFFGHDEHIGDMQAPTVTNYAVHYACQQCNYSTDQRKEFMAHKRTHAGVKSFSCEMCSAKFTRRYSLKKHLNQKHGPHTTSASTTRYCPFPSCNYVTRSANAMQVHRRSRHTSLYYCKVCNVKYSLRRSLLHHLTLHHRSNADFFGVRSFHEDGPPNSDSKTIAEENVSQLETSVQTEDAPVYRCDKCHFSAISLRGLYYHKRFKHPTKRKSKPTAAPRRRCGNTQGIYYGSRSTADVAPPMSMDNQETSMQVTNNQLTYSPVKAESVGDDTVTARRVTDVNHRRTTSSSQASSECYDPSIRANSSPSNAMEEYDEMSKLTNYIRCIQDSNVIMCDLYKRKTEELESLKRLTADFVRHVLPNHPIVRSRHSWKDVDSIMQHILNSNSTF